MKREALAKLNRHANETGQGFGTVKANPSRVLAQFWHSRGEEIAKTMGRRSSNSFGISRRFGRGGAIRTPDPLRPRQVRYQAALRPDILCFSDFKPLPIFPILSGRPNRAKIAPTVAKP